MKFKFFFEIIYILIFFLKIFLCMEVSSGNSYYYEEKYFRILSNNYDTIDPGTSWQKLDEDGFGFKAKKDFGSLILLKDWSMYNFKLTKVIFRKKCTLKYEENGKCDAEMWLYHTKDNGYYPPGRRIFIKENLLIIIVPLVRTDENNPSIDLLLHFLRLEEYSKDISKNISPEKPVKLYQIVQNQPSFLFESKYDNKETLFLVFTQYHFISNTEHGQMTNIWKNLNIKEIEDNSDVIETPQKVYRNMKNEDDLKPKVTLMAYSNANFLTNILFFIIIFLF